GKSLPPPDAMEGLRRAAPAVAKASWTSYGVVYAPGEEGYVAEVLGYHSAREKWVCLGRMPMDPPRPIPGKLLLGAMLTPLTMSLDVAAWITAILGTVGAGLGGGSGGSLQGLEHILVPPKFKPNQCQIQMAVKELMDQLPTPRAESVAKALRAFGPYAVPAVPMLRKLLEDSDYAIRLEAATTLGVLCRGDQEFYLPTFLWLLEYGDDWSAAGSARVLGELHVRDAVPALTETLRDENVTVRRNAAVSLGRIGSHSLPAGSALRKALLDEDAAVREAADGALWRIRGEWPVLEEGD
ncbi:MAG: HEAT repeat domain-containing protein, partial [Planctomycetota bacterium]